MFNQTPEEKKAYQARKIILNNFYIDQYIKSLPKKGRNYECPLCGHQHLQVRTRKDGWYTGKQMMTCFWAGCPTKRKEMDAYDLLESLRPDLSNFNERMNYIEKLFQQAQENGSISLDDYPAPESIVPTPEKAPEDLTAWFDECQKELEKSFSSLESKGQNRGISLETFLAAGVGFDHHYQRPDQIAKKSIGFKPAFIFPVSDHAYTHVDCRLMDELDRLEASYPDIKEYRRAKVGRPARPFNFDNAMNSKDDYVFVTEGGFDCLSVLEAGFNALSIESSDNCENFLDDIDLLLNYEKPGTDKTFLIICDNDGDGELANNYLDSELNKRGLKAVLVDNSFDGCKDANEYLTKYGIETLKDYLTEELRRALKPDDHLKETAIPQESAALGTDSNLLKDKEPYPSEGRCLDDEEYFLEDDDYLIEKERAFQEQEIALLELQERIDKGFNNDIEVLKEIYRQRDDFDPAINLYFAIRNQIEIGGDDFLLDNPLLALIWKCCEVYHEEAVEDETRYL